MLITAGQRNTNQDTLSVNYSVDTRATGSAHRDHPILSIRQSLPSRQPEEQARAGMNQHLNHGHDNPPPAYDNL